MLANITDPSTINRDSGPKPTPREPVVGPMIGRLGAYVTPTAPHQLALRCRRCPASRPFIARSAEDEGYGAHLLLREHWAARHATDLSALEPVRPTPPAPDSAAARPPTSADRRPRENRPTTRGSTQVTCIAVLVKGKRAGQVCGRKAPSLTGICPQHAAGRAREAGR